jgi:hypothetical protein
MKKLAAIFILLLCDMGVNAQGHKQGDLFITGGIGFGHYGYHARPGRPVNVGLPLTLNVDYGIVNYVSIGGYGGALFKDNHTAIGFGGRGSFHVWQMIDDLVAGDLRGDLFDIYASVYSGGEISGLYRDRFRIGAILGARWFFKENVALMVEFGGPMSYGNVGISLRAKN